MSVPNASRRAATGLLFLGGLTLAAPAAAKDAVESALSEHFAFEAYSDGNVRPEQITPDLWDRFVIVDTRDAGQYEENHIPGAIHVEWRTVLDNRDRLPKDKPLLLYCNTSSLSAQAALALKLVGYTNVKVLAGGFDAWKAKAASRRTRSWNKPAHPSAQPPHPPRLRKAVASEGIDRPYYLFFN
ncbi:rhodanese-like domain-containing protein [Thiohalorhabdus sp.]|uniref:rhodanese-like domain-containing protein n=1 Tax=Thiohalorhabdus sp. TaxID=3094134 RepID=UPI002FC3B076